MSAWIERLLTPNKFSRPQIPLLVVKGVILHWTANPGADDDDHVKFFDGADGGGSRYAGAHIFVDRDSALLDIPLNEVAYHANEKQSKIAKFIATSPAYKGGNANLTTIGIEMCVEKDGTIHPDTVTRTVSIVSELCKMFKLTTDDVYRHYDITSKNCPAPWVSNGQLFLDFKNRVGDTLNNPIAPVSTSKGAINKGSVVTVKTTATQYETGQTISTHVKGGKYTVLQVKDVSKSFSKKAYLLSGILSWVLEQDIVESGVNNGASTPAPVAPKPAPKPVSKKQYIKLPATSDSWRVYPLDKAPVAANAKGKLNPQKFSGLTYEILKDRGNWVFEIQTSNFGRVQIFGHPNTGAKVYEA